ncbi:unnamed protein product [Closterium sp. NIES-53]
MKSLTYPKQFSSFLSIVAGLCVNPRPTPPPQPPSPNPLPCAPPRPLSPPTPSPVPHRSTGALTSELHGQTETQLEPRDRGREDHHQVRSAPRFEGSAGRMGNQ